MVEWDLGPVAHTVLGKDNAISDVERGYGAFVPFYLSMVPIFMIDANDSFQRFITCPPLPLAYTMSNTILIWL